MKLAMGADHRGVDVLRQLCSMLEVQGYEITVLGEPEEQNCDYPDMAYVVGEAVAKGQFDRGVLICGSGIGMSIAANKIRGVRAALVHDEVSAEISRRHQDANVICLPADMLGPRIIDRIIVKWLSTEFEGGRHARRVDKIAAIEQGRTPHEIAHEVEQPSPLAKPA